MSSIFHKYEFLSKRREILVFDADSNNVYLWFLFLKRPVSECSNQRGFQRCCRALEIQVFAFNLLKYPKYKRDREESSMNHISICEGKIPKSQLCELPKIFSVSCTFKDTLDKKIDLFHF